MVSPAEIPRDTRAVCVGSGRFLRAVLVPFLQRASGDLHGGDDDVPRVAVFQPRGVGFADACAAAGLRYEVDTIHRDGRVTTDTVRLAGVGALARDADRRAFLRLPQTLAALRFVGVGITDAGFAPGNAVLRDLAMFLFACYSHIPGNVLSVINTDNVPSNGDLLRTRVMEAHWPECPARTSAAWAAFALFLDTKVHFHNTMVDRLTSHRANDPLVPLAEPWPSKVLAIQDSAGVLNVDHLTTATVPGVIVRATRDELLLDQKLKLRIANATSSALVYVLALSRYKTNNEARALPDLLAYRDALFALDLLPSLECEGVPRETALRVYNGWTHRSSHAHFGLVNFWVTQNAWLHFIARLFPSIRANVVADDAYRASPAMVFATASILRFLTPVRRTTESNDERMVYVGAMDDCTSTTPKYPEISGEWVYGSGLHANLTTGEYAFVDAPHTTVAARLLDAANASIDAGEVEVAAALRQVVTEMLSNVPGFDAPGFDAKPAYTQFAEDVSAMYTQLVLGRQTVKKSSLDVLRDVVAAIAH